MRLQTFLLFIALLFAFAPNVSAQTLILHSPSVTATSVLGTATFAYSFPAASGQSGQNVDVQLFLENQMGAWQEVSPVVTNTATGLSTPLMIPVYPGQTATGSFSLPIPAGAYTECRCILFADGSNFTQSVSDFTETTFNLAITTSQIQVTAPALVDLAPMSYSAGSATVAPSFSVTLQVKWPQSYAVADGGFWVQFKGAAGFAQGWVPASPCQTATGLDNYYYNNIVLSGPMQYVTPGTPGLYNFQYGLFNESFTGANNGLLQWLWPGDYVWVGPPPTQTPIVSCQTIAQAMTLQGKSSVAIGGNFGNMLAQQYQPSNVSASYFSLLRAANLSIIRTNFNADWYLASPTYQQAVDVVVQDILASGATPVLAPQAMPADTTLTAQATDLQTLDVMLASKYIAEPVILDICNEPSQYATWATWSPIAQKIATAMRAVSPNGTIWCPTENYESSAIGASAAPLPAGLVNDYCVHMYSPIPAAAPTAAAPYDLSFAGSNIPVIVEEEQNPALEQQIEVAAASGSGPGSNVKAVMSWAWTTPGQDSLAEVASINGATITYTSVGQQSITQYADWIAGITPTPPTTASGTGGASAADPDAASISAIQASLATIQSTLTAIQAQQTTNTAAIAAEAKSASSWNNYTVALYNWIVANVTPK